MDDFAIWSCKNAFTSEYFPDPIECESCGVFRKDAHMCAYNRGEIVKMQCCPKFGLTHAQLDLVYHIRYKNYVCKSCFIKCSPAPNFIKIVNKSIKIVELAMGNIFDKNFLRDFVYKIRLFLIKDTTLTCVPCSIAMKDYKWWSYKKLTNAYRKRRLESIE